eukprot:238154_1
MARTHISSPTSPNGKYQILKSSSYQSQRSQSQSVSQQSQLEANTKYNPGSMQSATYSILTENTGATLNFNDLSEPRTTNAFSIQQTPITTDTPLIQSDNEEEDKDEHKIKKIQIMSNKCKEFETIASRDCSMEGDSVCLLRCYHPFPTPVSINEWLNQQYWVQ